jgi:hypothetical protein
LLVGASSASAKLTVGTFGDTARAAQFHGGNILIDGGAATDLIMGDGNVAYMSLQTTDNATAMKIRDYSGNADLVTIERASGNVGIGTSSPTSPLHIKSATDVNVRFDDSGSSSYTWYMNDAQNLYIPNVQLASTHTFYANGQRKVDIDSSGNLLVAGTNTNPVGNNVVGHALSSDGRVQHSTTGNTVMKTNQTTDGDIVQFRKAGSAVGSIGTSTGGLYIADAGVGFRFDSGGTDDIIPCSASGAAADASINLGSSGARFKDLYLSGGAYVGGVYNTGIYNQQSGDIQFWVPNVGEAVRIQQNTGNLLVGTTNDTGTNAEGFLFYEGSGGSRLYIGHANGTANGTQYTVFNYNSTKIGDITQSGTTAVLYNTTSDERLKENITDANDAGSKIDAIQVRQYDWKADGSHQDYGMIAQELQTVAPEAVSGDADSEDMMGVDYSKLVPMLIKEIQSLRNRVAQLEE